MSANAVTGCWSAVVCLVAAAGVARGNGHGPRLATAPVPATQEIEVLDPGVDPTGKPAVVMRPDPNGFPGVQQVDIPPTVLVHRFYYTGDRTFQGPMIPGGPMIVAVSHPKTLERVYVPVVLPPGAPRVTYTSHAIRYDYGPQSVTLAFGACGKPRVEYGQASAAGQRVKTAATGFVAGTQSLVQRTGIPQGVQRFGQGAKSALGAGADLVGDAGRAVLTPVVNGVRSLPGAQLLQNTPEDKAERARDATQRQLERLPNPDDAFIRRNP